MKAKHRACTQLGNNVGLGLAFIVLLNKFLHVQTVEIASSICDPKGSENLPNINTTGDQGTESATNRTGKFLFDTLFNINTPLGDDDFDDDDEDDVKTCNCGECVRSICRIIWLEMGVHQR